MNIFDDLISIDKNGNFSYNKWVEWNHFLIPNTQKTLRNFMRKLLAFFGHCKKCSALDGCYLLENNRPQQPLHINCDCTRKTISLNQVRLKATAICPLIKFTDYIFKNKDKKIIYQSWGFTIEDSEKLQKHLEQEARKNYISGNYILKNLDEYGQRLSIPVNLSGNIFYSGWLLCPEGLIRNTTPFGGWVK